jgi:proprotein convertase subtilisin/kexin type 5
MPPGYLPDIATTYCKPCRSNCEVCTDNTDCSQCMSGYMLSADNSSCNQCVVGCRTCINAAECAECADKYWLNTISKTCVTCSFLCIKCSHSFHCDEFSVESDELITNNLRTSRGFCSYGNYVGGYCKNCVEYSSDRLKITLCSIVSNITVTCQNF